MIRAVGAATGALAVLLLSQCALQGAVPIVGVWSFSDIGEAETWVFTDSSVSITNQTGSAVTGTMSSSVLSVGAAQQHLLLQVRSDTGFYNTVPAGTQWYVTWSMSGNNLYLSGSFVSYPPSAATGPFAPSGQAQ